LFDTSSILGPCNCDTFLFSPVMAIYIALPSKFGFYLSLVSALVGASLCF
jgi:hypothetical protein